MRGVNELLTRVMAKQKIQALIKGQNLDHICDVVLSKGLVRSDSQNRTLICAAVLGRLSAVARGREGAVFSRLSDLFSETQPGSIEALEDGDEKYYASLCLAELNQPWLAEYCLNQAVDIDTAEKARRVLLSTALSKFGSLAGFLLSTSKVFPTLKAIDSDDTRYKRARRLSSVSSDVIRQWEGDVGYSPGVALSEWFSSVTMTSRKDVDVSVLVDLIDDTLSILLRVIELRFSFALIAETYSVLDRARTTFKHDVWVEIMRRSQFLEKVRTALKESALVLARQNSTDKGLMDSLRFAYYSKAQARAAIIAHFSSAHELDPDVREWWERAGDVSSPKRVAEHKVSNSDDQQIGSLLINVEESKTVMEKLERAVVPMLEVMEPALSENVKKAALSYGEISETARHLAKMRKLKHMGLKGAVLDYNPLQHEMLGGHQYGVRKVKVLRDGIQKDFGGKTKILVKPRVKNAD
ncbi:hypothetical protein F0521_40970 [Ferrimonas sp. YFM]|nr:hypothetical protein F0521_40970 [Ferrimonas sp. YFM]